MADPESPHKAKELHVRFIERGKGKGGGIKRTVEESERGGVTGKGKPNGFWEYGGYCLGNGCTGRTVTYEISQVSEVLVQTVRIEGAEISGIQK